MHSRMQVASEVRILLAGATVADLWKEYFRHLLLSCRRLLPAQEFKRQASLLTRALLLAADGEPSRLTWVRHKCACVHDPLVVLHRCARPRLYIHALNDTSPSGATYTRRCHWSRAMSCCTSSVRGSGCMGGPASAQAAAGGFVTDRGRFGRLTSVNQFARDQCCARQHMATLKVVFRAERPALREALLCSYVSASRRTVHVRRRCFAWLRCLSDRVATTPPS